MTPAEKKASELVSRYRMTHDQNNNPQVFSPWSFEAGFKAALELAEVKGLEEALQTVENVFSKDDRFIGVVSGALTAWRSFRGEK